MNLGMRGKSDRERDEKYDDSYQVPMKFNKMGTIALTLS